MKSYKTENFSWLHFENPDKDDLAAIQKTFNLHPVVLSEFNTPTYRPRVSDFGDYIFMVLHFPLFDKETRTPQSGEIDIVLNDKFLVTSTTKHQHHLYQFFESLKKDQKNPTASYPKSSLILLLSVLEIMLNSCFPKLDHIADRLDTIETEIFEGKEKQMVKEISLVKRDILNFRRNIKPQRSILESLASKKWFKESIDLKAKVNDIIGHNIRLWNVLQNHKETVDSLEATNDSLFSHKMNHTMKVIAIFSVIFLPANLIATLFGANVQLPIDQFWIVVLFVFLSFLTTLIFIKFRKWI